MGPVTAPVVPHRPPRQTLLFLHAHPDDEATSTAGTIARAAAQGHRVIVVYGTNGDHGEAPADLGPGETVLDRRRAEAEQSARILGTARVGWLGYADSGMTGWAENAAANAFCNADLDQAAGRLAAVLDDEHVDVLVCYDSHGGYGHPDHIQVHRVGHRAADLAAHHPRVLEVTMNRDAMRRLRASELAAAQAQGIVLADDATFDPDAPMDDGNPMGTPEAEITWQVDVRDHLDLKRAAMRAHASQVSDIGYFMSLTPEVFAASFGAEYYIEPGLPPGPRVAWILDEPPTGGVPAPAGEPATGQVPATGEGPAGSTPTGSGDDPSQIGRTP
jgi:LmbE family N-acetylglucosaminyl deacetylase